ncbi:unnamed protein product [Nippostrongylus brasiliensis]|uniref:Aldedh domain-containing protein n=1 Tax=Nippostrongylus brasiliensis TaxID=27835 RepID=A0A0N4XCA5_NIPBR|nr:unnamed protein product [Nippostrongylus brasiliensis]
MMLVEAEEEWPIKADDPHNAVWQVRRISGPGVFNGHINESSTRWLTGYGAGGGGSDDRRLVVHPKATARWLKKVWIDVGGDGGQLDCVVGPRKVASSSFAGNLATDLRTTIYTAGFHPMSQQGSSARCERIEPWFRC